MFTERSELQFCFPWGKHQACWLGGKGPEKAGSRGQSCHGGDPVSWHYQVGCHKTQYFGWHQQAQNQLFKKKGRSSKIISVAEDKDVLKDTRLPEDTRCFGTLGVSTWFLQQGNDPTDRVSELVVKYWNIKMDQSSRLFLFGRPPPLT